jgi:hypothetical protein
MQDFINNINSDAIKLTKNDQTKIKNITFNSNPIIIFYEN